MKNRVYTYAFRKIIWGSILSLFAFSAIFASNGNDAAKTNVSSSRTSTLVVQNLTQILKTDLVQEKVAVKLGNLEQTAISNNEVTLQGSAICLLPVENTQLPITFEAKFNLASQTVDDIQYTFVESEYAPTSEEEILMRELMQKISRDYKTQEIVIALDNFETSASNGNRLQYKGIGEVKIGSVQWSKIDFDVTLNSNKTAAKIEYKIKE
jgi:hypothetical protein